MVAVLAAIAAVLPFSSAAGAAPASRTILNAPFRGVNAPSSTFDLVESVIDYSPGAKSPVISTQTPYYLSVLGGELTVDVDGKADVVAAGKGLSVPSGAKLSLSNASARQNARLFVTTLLAVAAVDQVHQPNSPGIRVFASGRRTMFKAPSVVDIIQAATEYDPGFRTPNHVMNEFHLFIQLAGQTSYHYTDGSSQTFGPGAQAVMDEGRAGWMGNDGSTPSLFAMTWVATPGKPLTSPAAAAAPAPPRTGNGIAPSGDARWSALGWLLIAIAGGAAVESRLRRRKRTSEAAREATLSR